MALLVSKASSGGSYISGSFHYDLVSGNDSNNGIPIGEVGSGNTLNGVAGTGPRQSVSQLQTDLGTTALSGGRYSGRNNIYLSPGTWTLTDEIAVQSGMTSADSNSMMKIMALPGQKSNTIIDIATNGAGGALHPSGEAPIQLAGANIQIGGRPSVDSGDGFIVQTPHQSFNLGSTYSYGDPDGYNCGFVGLTFDQVGSSYAGDNSGFIMVQNAKTVGFFIIGCTATGALNNSNESLIYTINTRGLIDYCNLWLLDTGTSGVAYHHKKGLNLVNPGDITIKRSIIRADNIGRRCFHGNMAMHDITDCLMILDAPRFGNVGDRFGSVRSDASSGTFTDGYRMRFLRNTVHSLDGNVPMRWFADPGNNQGQTPGGDCEFRDNALINTHIGIGWTDAIGQQDHQAIMDFNSIEGTRVGEEWGVSQTSLATWQGNTTRFASYAGDTHDQRSVHGTHTFVSVTDPTDPSTYEQDTDSVGYTVAEDNGPTGITPDDCGPQAIGF